MRSATANKVLPAGREGQRRRSRRGLYARRDLRAGDMHHRERHRRAASDVRPGAVRICRCWSAGALAASLARRRGVRSSQTSRSSVHRESAQHPAHRRLAPRATGAGVSHALRSLGLPGSVIVTDVNPLSPAVHVADRAYRVPLAHRRGLSPELLAICETERDPPRRADDRRRAAAASARHAHQLPPLGALRRPARQRRRRRRSATTSTQTCAHLRRGRRAAAATYLPGELPAKTGARRCSSSRASAGARSALSDPSRARARVLSRLRAAAGRAGVSRGPEFTIDVLCDLTASRCRSCRASAS